MFSLRDLVPTPWKDEAEQPWHFMGGVVKTAWNGCVGGAVGALNGFVYSKLADLPKEQSVKAWAVFFAALSAIQAFISHFVESSSRKEWLSSLVTVVGTGVGIQELRKRGVIGDKMVIALVALQTLSLFGSLKVQIQFAPFDVGYRFQDGYKY